MCLPSRLSVCAGIGPCLWTTWAISTPVFNQLLNCSIRTLASLPLVVRLFASLSGIYTLSLSVLELSFSVSLVSLSVSCAEITTANTAKLCLNHGLPPASAWHCHAPLTSTRLLHAFVITTLSALLIINPYLSLTGSTTVYWNLLFNPAWIVSTFSGWTEHNVMFGFWI